MKYDTLFFDFDGTVVNSIEAIVLSVRDTFDHFNFPQPSEEEIKKYIGVPIQNYFPYLAQEYYAHHKSEDVINKYREIYKTGYGLTHVTAYDGMKKLLQNAKSRGVKLGVVSSKITEPIYANLKALDMEGLFDAVVGSDQVTQFKPLPETVLLCAQKLGMEDATKALVIGDAVHDIEMGRRAGMDTCAVAWGAGTIEGLSAENPTYFPKTVSELLHLLQV